MSEQDQPPLDRIRDRLEDLSPNDRLVAEAVLRDPTGAAFLSADQLAGQAGVSKAAVVRFGARLGYGGFAGLQEALQGGVRERLEAVDDAPAPHGSLVDRWLTAVEADLRAVAGTTTPATLEQAATLLETGEGWIHVFGQRASAAVAEYAYFLLNPMLPNVVRVEAGESALADRLIGVGPEDRLLAFTFRRYAKVTTEVAAFFQEAGAPVVLVTDSPAAPAARHATEVLVCADDSPAPFPTAVTGIFLVELLAATLLERNPSSIGRRLDDAERIWGRFGTYGAEAGDPDDSADVRQD
ncbi:MAG: MurR/RpiR family transcriptional regulator [Actinomycetota bacterium]